MSEQFRPSGDRVLLRPKEAPEQISGIFVPNAARERPNEGEALAFGPYYCGNASVGDTVLFGKYCGTEITCDGQTLLILKEGDILGIIEREDAVLRLDPLTGFPNVGVLPNGGAEDPDHLANEVA